MPLGNQTAKSILSVSFSSLNLCKKKNIYIYIYIYTYTHTHGYKNGFWGNILKYSFPPTPISEELNRIVPTGYLKYHLMPKGYPSIQFTD